MPRPSCVRHDSVLHIAAKLLVHYSIMTPSMTLRRVGCALCMTYTARYRSQFRSYNRAYAYRGLTALASLSLAVSECLVLTPASASSVSATGGTDVRKPHNSTAGHQHQPSSASFFCPANARFWPGPAVSFRKMNVRYKDHWHRFLEADFPIDRVNACFRHTAVTRPPTSERPFCNNCGHSRGGQFNSQDARYCRFGLMALSLMTGHPTWVMLRVKSASGPKML